MEQKEKGIFSLPIVKFAPFLAAGMLFAYFAESVFVWAIPLSAIGFAAAFAKKRKLAPCFAGLFLGLVLMTLHVEFYCKPIMEYNGKTVRTEFKVVEILKCTKDKVEFNGEISLGGLRANVRLTGEAEVSEGYFGEAEIELSEPDPLYLTQNLAKGILLSGEITEYHSINPAKINFRTIIGALRGRLYSALRENVAGESGEIASAILFGRDECLSQTLTERFRISGAAHYTAVSGAHFTILAAVLLDLIPQSRRKLRSILSILTAAAAVVFFGYSASVFRASVMFLINAAAPLLHRRSETLNTLCLTVSAILLISPGAVLDIGFAMSVLGVFGAGVVAPRLSERLCGLLPEKAEFLSAGIRIVCCSFCALVCTSPVSAAVFKGVSLGAVFTSILIMPLMTVGMTFMILLGALEIGVLGMPIDLAMRAVSAIIKLFGNARGMYLSLDFEGAWILAAVCAALLTFGAFGTMKTLRRCSEGMAVVTLLSLLITTIRVENRREIRFIGNYRTSAAVAFCGREAAVFVSGNGVGLAEDVSRCLRERGAVKISVLAAFEADYCGAVSLRELSGLVETDRIFTNEIAAKLLNSAEIVDENAVFSLNGRTFVGAKTSGKSAAGDFVLYHGTAKMTESAAKTGIIFANSERIFPENVVNVRLNREFSVPLDGEKLHVKISENSEI